MNLFLQENLSKSHCGKDLVSFTKDVEADQGESDPRSRELILKA